MASDPPGIEKLKPTGGVQQPKIALFRPLAWGLGLLLILAAMGGLVAPPFPTSPRHKSAKPNDTDNSI
jgi:hypothetical protein